MMPGLQEDRVADDRAHRGRGDQAGDTASAPRLLLKGLLAFRGPVLVILSGDDIGAHEFDALQRSTPAWRAWRRGARISQAGVPHATHTFSRAGWREQVEQLCSDWLGSW